MADKGIVSTVDNGKARVILPDNNNTVTGDLQIAAHVGTVQVSDSVLVEFWGSGSTDGIIIENLSNNYNPVSTVSTTTYIHTQIAPGSAWPIIHNMSKWPSVTVVDSSGNQVVGDVSYTDVNSLTISFSAGFAGYAYLN